MPLNQEVMVMPDTSDPLPHRAVARETAPRAFKPVALPALRAALRKPGRDEMSAQAPASVTARHAAPEELDRFGRMNSA